MIKALKLLFSLIVFTTILGASGLWWGMKEFHRPALITHPYLFEINRGETIASVADNLYNEGIITRPLVFGYAARFLKLADQIKAGEYQLLPQMNGRDILDLFVSGKTYQRLFTIREGLTSYEIIQELAAIKDMIQLPVEAPAEGTLLPESYSYQRGDSNLDALARMEKAMTQTIDTLWAERSADLPFKTKEEALILASIVEKETGIASERARIAGVFINRLKRGMKLQTDPTVIYALTQGQHQNAGQGPLGRRLLRKDMEIDSPYNTYLYAGLPPTPIANPGFEAIKATLHPEAHDDLYFVADGTGGHVFAKTLDEHNRNVRIWRALRRGNGG